MSESITKAVQSQYASLAGSGLSSNNEGVKAVAEAFGYTADELLAIPAEANMGVSCGNPTALANIRPGEVVVDLGCGGGMDIFLAAKKVGPTGKAIGIDMTSQMLELARRNSIKAGGGKPLANVEFHLAGIEKLPLPDASVDCVISNCVLNLVPDKSAAFREIFRVLKPGGRLAASDIALKKTLPPAVAQNIMAYVGCIAGAILIKDYQRSLAEAGFDQVQIVDSGAGLSAYEKVENQASCCSSPAPAPQASCCSAPAPASASLPVASSCCSGKPQDVHTGLRELISQYDVNEYAASVKVYALKPTA
jgi:arsenite methyltransferase